MVLRVRGIRPCTCCCCLVHLLCSCVCYVAQTAGAALRRMHDIQLVGRMVEAARVVRAEGVVRLLQAGQRVDCLYLLLEGGLGPAWHCYSCLLQSTA
jgi:hypothetical protein